MVNRADYASWLRSQSAANPSLAAEPASHKKFFRFPQLLALLAGGKKGKKEKNQKSVSGRRASFPQKISDFRQLWPFWRGAKKAKRKTEKFRKQPHTLRRWPGRADRGGPSGPGGSFSPAPRPELNNLSS